MTDEELRRVSLQLAVRLNENKSESSAFQTVNAANTFYKYLKDGTVPR